jgi:hypothetical protein
MSMRRAALAMSSFAALAANDAAAADAPDVAMAQHAEEVVRYTLVATLDPVKHTVHGDGTLKWRNTSSAKVSELWMHLYLNAFKNERSLFLRTPLNGGRGGGPVKDWGFIDVGKLVLAEGPDGKPADLLPSVERSRPGDPDETDARVPLPREIAPGETITIEMSWDDKLPAVIERTGYDGSFHMVAQWFPKIARLEPDGTWAHFPFHRLSEFYADFGTFDVTLDVPQAFTIGATGPLVESRAPPGRRVERHVQSDVHDFAWTAWDKWESIGDTIEGVDVKLLYPPGYGASAARGLATMRFVLPYFGRRYGPYPYALLTVVHPPDTAREAGGMEYPTLITTGGPWYEPSAVRAIELVTAHEFGHQYFYGLIATNENKWPFLDEGINSFAEQDALGAWLGAGTILDLAGFTFSDAALQAVGSNPAARDEKVAQPAPAFVTGSNYGALVYFRTGTIMATLRRVYGDEKMADALGRYARKNRFRHPGPEALLASIEEVMGAPAAANLHTALFDKGWVDYAVVAVNSHPTQDPAGVFDRNGKRETVAEGQKSGAHEGSIVLVRRGTLSFPVDVELTLEDGSTQRTRWNAEVDMVRIPYAGASPLRGVVVDPDERVLVDQTRMNNFGTAPSAPRAGTPRTSERLFYWAQLALQQVLP